MYYSLKQGAVLRNDKKRAIIYRKDGHYIDKMRNDAKLENDISHYTLTPQMTIILFLMDGSNTLNDILKFVKNYFKLNDEQIDKLKQEILMFKDFYYTHPNQEDNKKYTSIKRILPNLNNIDKYDMNPFYCYYPYSLLFLPTMNCVVDCKYCYADRKHTYNPLSFDRVKEFIKEAIEDFEFKSIDISGGDIFIYKYYKELLQLLSENGYFPELPTKKVLNKELYFLKELGFKSFQYSLDTFNPKTSEILLNRSKGAEYIEGIKKSIRLAGKLGLKVAINCIVSQISYKDIKSFLDELLKFDNIYRTNVNEMGYSMYLRDNMEELMLKKEHFDKLEEECSNLFDIANKKIEFFKRPDPSLYWGYNPIIPAIKKEEYWNRALCTGGRQGFIILPDGKVTCCEELYWHPDYIIGDLKTQSIREVADSEKRWNLLFPKQEDFPEDSPCRYCEKDNFDKCHQERGRCWRESLKFFGKSKYPDPRCPFYKELAKEHKLDIKYHKAMWDIEL